MKLFIVSGLSGSGKSTVLHVLEDLGFYCIDNLPLGLLANFAAHMASTPEKSYENAAVGIDARNRSGDLRRFPSILAGLRESKLECEVIFLDADDHILIKRYSETRRRHPLSSKATSLAEAIGKERELLEPVIRQRDLYIDTSHTNLHQLRDLVRERIAHRGQQTLSLMFQSFGFKHGVPVDADFVFDVRCLPNPYWDQQLREYTGRDKPVIEFLEDHDVVDEMYQDIVKFITNWVPRFRAADRTYVTIAVGCTGGQHRSVYFAEKLAQHFSTDYEVLARHRELA
ncbi:MAG: RNase adapter RapZ [Gammaproteobacteria bacterium]|nr:RNase adapter RapZ [Gammaproteobacteria bacterium]